MTDYYPLIARAVAALPKNTGDGRRALYERARTALVAQLRGVTPALNESEITRERLALEEAIRKVEGESARQAWAEPMRAEPIPKMRAPEPAAWEETDAPEDSPSSRPEAPPPRQSPPRMPRAAPPPPPPPRQPSPPPPRRNQPEPPPQVEASYEPDADQAPAAPEPQRPPRDPARTRFAGSRRSLMDSGLKDFREVVSEADDLGAASARSAKSARDNYSGIPASPGRDFDEPQQWPPEPQDVQGSFGDFATPRMLEPEFNVDDSRPMPPSARGEEAPRTERGARPLRSLARAIRLALILIVCAGLGSLLAWQWPNLAAVYRYVRAPAPQVAQDVTPTQKPKIPDRLDPSGLQQQPADSPGGQNAAVAQRVVLYEEDPADPQGKRLVGSAIWRTETLAGAPGQPPEVAIRADVEIPERRLTMTWSLRRNVDKSPASHTVEIMFKLPADFPSGGIANVPGILMKQTEQTRGVPLAGVAVKVTNGYFLIGLSGVDGDRERNLQLLKDRAWLDIPVVYGNSRRAILALEKGTPGERAFADAFKAWGQ
jgi:hypothetical protein